MTEPGQRVYPNPSSNKTWTDERGRVWQRQGDRRDRLDVKRVRRLLRRDGVPLVTWAAGEVQWFEHPGTKEPAAEALYGEASHPGDVEPREWRSDDGVHMLMLEHHC